MLGVTDFSLALAYFYNGRQIDFVDSSNREVLIEIDISQFADLTGAPDQCNGDEVRINSMDYFTDTECVATTSINASEVP